MVKLRRVGVLSVGKICGILGVIIGLIVGVGYAIAFAIAGAVSGNVPFGGLLGAFAIVAFPVMYGVIGFLGGVIDAFLYNIIAGWIGGIELHFEEQTQAGSITVTPQT